MTLRLDNLRITCILGDLPEERVTSREIEVDIELVGDFPAIRTDDLVDTVDYAELARKLEKTLVEAKAKMIEHAAYLLREVCLKEKFVTDAKVTIRKRGTLPNLVAASFTI